MANDRKVAGQDPVLGYDGRDPEVAGCEWCCVPSESVKGAMLKQFAAVMRTSKYAAVHAMRTSRLARYDGC